MNFLRTMGHNGVFSLSQTCSSHLEFLCFCDISRGFTPYSHFQHDWICLWSSIHYSIQLTILSLYFIIFHCIQSYYHLVDCRGPYYDCRKPDIYIPNLPVYHNLYTTTHRPDETCLTQMSTVVWGNCWKLQIKSNKEWAITKSAVLQL